MYSILPQSRLCKQGPNAVCSTYIDMPKYAYPSYNIADREEIDRTLGVWAWVSLC